MTFVFGCQSFILSPPRLGYSRGQLSSVKRNMFVAFGRRTFPAALSLVREAPEKIAQDGVSVHSLLRSFAILSLRANEIIFPWICAVHCAFRFSHAVHPVL